MTLQSDEPNADSALVVRFYTQAVQNNFLSSKEGRPIFEDKDMVEILIPGRNDLTNVCEVGEHHKSRFPIQWVRYQANKTSDQVIGTPLSQWGRVTPAMVENLKAVGFPTVESIAGASDQVISNIGMLVGMSPHVFREHARTFLRLSSDESALSKANEQINELKAQMAKLEQLMMEKGKQTEIPVIDQIEVPSSGFSIPEMVPSNRRGVK